MRRPKLTHEEAKRIRVAVNRHNTPLSEITENYGITGNALWRLLTGRSYKTAGGPVTEKARIATRSDSLTFEQAARLIHTLREEWPRIKHSIEKIDRALNNGAAQTS